MIPHGHRLCMLKEGKGGLSQADRKCIRENCEAWIDEAERCSITLLGEVLLNVLSRFRSGDKIPSGANPMHDV